MPEDPNEPEVPEEPNVPADPADMSLLFSAGSGIYSQTEMDLTIMNPGGNTVCYTTDGSLPTGESAKVTGPIYLTTADTNSALIDRLSNEFLGGGTLMKDASLPTATVIRAAVLRQDGTMGPVMTHTYFLG